MNDTIDWYETSEQTPDVFGRPQLAPQGQDGTAHFNYYDGERSLSFQWDGHFGQHVVVSYGGYGEPIKWTFDFREMWQKPAPYGATTPMFQKEYEFASAAAHFQRACDAWIAWMEAPSVPDDGLHYEEGTIFNVCFDQKNPNWTPQPEHNELFLRGVQNHMNNVLAAREHLFLNEVYDALHVPRTREGAVMGWIRGEGTSVFFQMRPADGGGTWIGLRPDGVIYDKI